MSANADNPDLLKIAKSLLAEASQRSPGEVPDDADITNWEGWNSLVHMRLIMALENYLKCELTPEMIVEITSLDDVVQHLA